MNIHVHPLSTERWDDFLNLFGPRGACAGCWCMFWKLSHKEFEAGKGDTNRDHQFALVKSGTVPGLIVYADGVAAGWIAVEPRSAYPGLGRSKILAPLDEKPVWSTPCFFVEKKYRRQGLTVALLKAAIAHVKANGGEILEGYPVETESQNAPPVFIYTGTMSAFRAAGFYEAGRRSATRPIMRYTIK